MLVLKHTAKIRDYLDYLEEHVLNVRASWVRLRRVCADMPFTHGIQRDTVGLPAWADRLLIDIFHRLREETQQDTE